jgi:deferrochelatase/peroxidase EfeB
MTLDRRQFLKLAGAGTAGAMAFTISGCGGEGSPDAGDVVAFFGARQAGIVTPAQEHLHFAAFDVTTTDRARLVQLLQAWTIAAAAMTQGSDVGEYGAMDGPHLAPPEDTGEAHGLRPARLTITFGLGPGLFEDDTGTDRFGLASQRPRALRALPHFAGDNIDAARSGGELCIQACADDPVVAVHAVRNLARIGFGTVAMRWSQLGFGRTSSTSDAQTTPRNLMGFKDGTANIKAEHDDLLDDFVWVGAGDDPSAPWLVGGSFLVARRIKMHIETWDRTSLQEQEDIIGREKAHGAPLSGGDEFTEPDFAVPGANGSPIIPIDAHMRLAHPTENQGSRMLRRGYNFTDGSNGLGNLEAGLFFLAYTRDPDQHFIPLQTNLARNDSLNEYIQHTTSAIFAIPPGSTDGSYIGQTLFEH